MVHPNYVITEVSEILTVSLLRKSNIIERKVSLKNFLFYFEEVGYVFMYEN